MTMTTKELLALVAHLFATGYGSGHHATVEGHYTDVLPCDLDTYFEDHDAVQGVFTALCAEVEAQALEQGLPDMESVRGMVEDLKDCGRLCEAYSPDTIATAIPGIGWIAMRHKLNKAADMLTALASDTGERGVTFAEIEWAAKIMAKARHMPPSDALRAQPAGGGFVPADLFKSADGGMMHEVGGRMVQDTYENGVLVSRVPYPAPPESGGQGQGWRTLAEATPDVGQLVAVHAPGAMLADVWPAHWNGHSFDAGGGWFEQDEVTCWAELPAAPAQPDGVK